MRIFKTKPTQRSGILFVAFIMVAAGILRTRNNLLYLVFAIIALCFVIGWFGPAVCSRFIRIKRQCIPAAHQGTEIPLTVSVRNSSKGISSPAVILENANGLKDGAVTPVLTGALAPGSEISFELPLYLHKRGLWKLEPLKMVSAFPMGLFERVWTEPEDTEILVYPRVVGLRDRMLEGISVNLTKFTSVPDTEREVQALRAYQEGDSLRRVNWKASARRDDLIVGEYHRVEKRAKVALYLDISGGSEELQEDAISIIGSLSLFYHSKKRLIKLVTAREEITFGKSERKMKAVLKMLALLGTEDMVPLKRKPRPENSCLTVLIHSGNIPPGSHMCDLIIGPREFGKYAPELGRGKRIKNLADNVDKGGNV